MDWGTAEEKMMEHVTQMKRLEEDATYEFALVGVHRYLPHILINSPTWQEAVVSPVWG